MASATPGDPHLPSLSTPNLRKLDAGKSDKTSFLRSYIRSQEAHLASYAREGKSLAATSVSPSVQPAVSSRPTKRVRDVESLKEEGNNAFKSGRLEEAVEKYGEAIDVSATLSEHCWHDAYDDCSASETRRKKRMVV